MKKTRLFLLINILLILCLSIFVKCDEVKRRPKRYLGFIDKSKYFMRINLKHNMIPETRVFAQASGFRMNFETPKRVGYNYGKLRKKMQKRDLYQNLEQLILQQGFDGRICIQRAVCEAAKLTSKNGFLLKLFQKIFTVPEEEIDDHPHLNLDQCDQIQGTCPLSLMHLSRFTDD